jgi:CubicO group peptidase (beta-lactamase class C family)
LKRYLMSREVLEQGMLWGPEEGRFMYSNIGYEILGAIIAEASGMDFESFIEENIFKPLDMRDSSFLTWRRTEAGRGIDAESAGAAEIVKALNLEALRRAGVCTPHTKDAENRVIRHAHFPYNRAHAPSSTLSSSLGDMKKWGDALLSGRLLRPETREKAAVEYALVPNNGEHIGLGCFIRVQNGHTLYGHEGTDDGFRASFWFRPELDLQITVLSNIDRAPVKKINKHVFDILTGEA